MPSLSSVQGGQTALPDLNADLSSALATAGAGRAPATRTGATTAARRASGPAKAATTRKAAPKKAATTKQPTTGYAATLPAGYAFLKDPNLSVEDKLLRFTMLVAKETNDDVVQRLQAMAAKGGKGATSGATSGAGGTSGAGPAAAPPRKKLALWDVAKAVVPALGLASSVVGDAAVKGLVKQVSGPVLAAAASALGMPMLAPLALKAGPALADFVTSGSVGGSGGAGLGDFFSTGGTGASAAGAGGSTGSGSASAGTVTAEDRQQELMLLQHALDKQKEMTSLVSNMLKSMHDARMGVIQNLR